MRSPPSSSGGLFLSSPHHYLRNGPEDEVETLFASARKIKTLNNQLAAVIDHHKLTFLDVFGRQIQLLKSRSQAFEDAHITVYDKVLLLLTNNGNDLESPAAITWYCSEYLGINPKHQSDDNVRSIEAAITVPHALTQALTPSSSRKNSEPLIGGKFHAPVAISESTSSQRDPVFARLWSVYTKAHTEYLSVADKPDDRTIEVAKFLRDTAENGMYFLRDKYPNDPNLTELTDTYNMAKAAVLKLNGGRKRKFDPNAWTEAGLDRKKYTPHTVEHDRHSFGVRKYVKSKEKRKPRGRGPSGIPYGYSRPVDSWYPK